MSTELTNTNQPKAPIEAGQYGLELRSIEQFYRFAQYVTASGLAPKSLRRPESVMVALQYGAELGLKPMQSLSNIADINGKACLYGDGLKAVVEGAPECEYVQETIEGEGDAMIATCTAKRVGRAEATVRTFSVDDAKRAKLWGKGGPWVTYPQRMLQMRARAWCLRDQFADLLCGLGVVEEQQDVEPHAPASKIGKSDLEARLTGEPEDEPIEGEVVEPAAAAQPQQIAGDGPAFEPQTPPADDGPPSMEELAAAGQVERETSEDPGVGKLFDAAPGDDYHHEGY